jgi:hypothetical protein
MQKLPRGIRKDESLNSRSIGFSQRGDGDLLGDSYFKINLTESAVVTPKTFEPSTRKTELSKDRTDQEKFDHFLGEAIDETLSSLGELVKNTVYQRLQNDCCIEKDEIPGQIEEFSDIIHQIFGLGAIQLEIKFMKNLNSKIKINIQRPQYEWPLSKWIIDDLSFTQFVHNARKNFLNECKKYSSQKVQFSTC